MARLTEARLREIWRRQSPGRWGQDYEPALKVRRNEAPATSRPSILWSQKLGRRIHVMSKAEQITAILLQYLPNIFEIHEQKLLPTCPEEHPLAAHYRELGQQVPMTRGTVAISEALGFLHRHPTVYIEGDPVPFNYIGDFLAFSMDDMGPFCINVSVKNSIEAFYRKHGQVLNKGKKSDKQNLGEINRHRLEELLYEEWGIKTVKFAADCIDKNLSYNLTHAYKWHARPVLLDDEMRLVIMRGLQNCLEKQISPSQVSDQICKEANCSAFDLKAIFFQSIWNRQLRPDLYKPIQFDIPLKPEKKSPLSEFSYLYQRSS